MRPACCRGQTTRGAGHRTGRGLFGMESPQGALSQAAIGRRHFLGDIGSLRLQLVSNKNTATPNSTLSLGREQPHAAEIGWLLSIGSG